MTSISEALEGPGTLAFFRAAAILKLCKPLIIIIGVLTSRNITCILYVKHNYEKKNIYQNIS